ncbi:MAG TPA: hypothetical protein PKZ01_02600 [Candidatus Hydrogenedentes bacterium]|nr:hypothetical protein [Candidatus Hydrogenedentota bacterium]
MMGVVTKEQQAAGSPATNRRRMAAWEWYALAGILCLGAALRAAYLIEFIQDPSFSLPRPDPAFHDDWARALSGQYDPAHPVPYGPGQPDNLPFIRPPAYPYFLAALYALNGGSYLWTYAMQMTLGLFSVALGFFLARALMGRAVALTFSFLFASYWVFVYYESQLHAIALTLFLQLLFMGALYLWARRPTGARALAAGLIMALLALANSVVLTFVPVALAWLLYVARRKTSWFAAFVSSVAFAAGLALGIAPVTFHNHRVTGAWTAITPGGGLVLYMGNNPDATGSYAMPDKVRASRSLYDFMDVMHASFTEQTQGGMSTAEADRYYGRKALAYMLSHPGKTLTRMAMKAALFASPFEFMHNYTVVEYDRAFSRVLGRLPGNFAYALTGFLIGGAAWAASWFRRREKTAAQQEDVFPAQAVVVAMACFVFCGFLSYLPFFVVSQFRVPLIPFMLLFGAYGLVAFAGFLTERQWKKAAVMAAGGAILYATCSMPLAPFDSKENLFVWHFQRALDYARLGEDAVAEREFALAADAQPEVFRMYAERAVTLTQSRDFDAAWDECNRAVSLYRSVSALDPLGACLAIALAAVQMDRYDDAFAICEETYRKNPDLATAFYEVAVELSGEAVDAYARTYPGDAPPTIASSKQGQMALAVRCLERYATVRPDDANGQWRLVQTLLAVGSPAEVLKRCVALVEKGPDFTPIRVGLAAAFRLCGQDDQALAHLQQAVRDMPTYAEAQAQLGYTLLVLDRKTEAVAALEIALRLDPAHPWAAKALSVAEAHS